MTIFGLMAEMRLRRTDCALDYDSYDGLPWPTYSRIPRKMTGLLDCCRLDAKLSGRLPSLEMYPRCVILASQSVVVGRMANGRQRKRNDSRRQVENVADVLDSAFNGINAKPHGAQPHGLGLDQDILGCGGAVLNPKSRVLLKRWVAADKDDDRRLRNDVCGGMSFNNPLSRGQVFHHHEMPGAFVPFRMGCHCCLQQRLNGFLADGLIAIPTDMESRGNNVHKSAHLFSATSPNTRTGVAVPKFVSLLTPERIYVLQGAGAIQ